MIFKIFNYIKKGIVCVFRVPKYLLMIIIRGYQKTLSPDHGPLRHWFPGGYCRFMPTCSQYSYEAVKKYGVLRGGIKAIIRIVRCNPFSKGGDDPLK